MAEIGRKTALKALKTHARLPLTELNYEAHGQSLQNESDRGTVIMTAATIEDSLTSALRYKMQHLNTKEMDELFDFNGPMGTFSAKIKCALAFGIISRATRNHIEMIREMRNACAHSQHPLTFGDEVLRDATYTMLDQASAKSFEGNPTYLRLAFVMVTGVLANIIMEGDAARGAARVNAIIDEMRREGEL